MKSVNLSRFKREKKLNQDVLWILEGKLFKMDEKREEWKYDRRTYQNVNSSEIQKSIMYPMFF